MRHSRPCVIQPHGASPGPPASPPCCPYPHQSGWYFPNGPRTLSLSRLPPAIPAPETLLSTSFLWTSSPPSRWSRVQGPLLLPPPLKLRVHLHSSFHTPPLAGIWKRVILLIKPWDPTARGVSLVICALRVCAGWCWGSIVSVNLVWATPFPVVLHRV